MSSQLATVEHDEGLGQEDQVTVRVLRALVTHHWDEALVGIESTFLQHRIELCLLATRGGHLNETLRDQILELIRVDPIWAGRIDEF